VIVVCGEALIDLVPDDSSGVRFTAIPGGSPANTAIASARLGVPTALAARLSGDAFGRRLRAHLAGNGVDLSLAVAAAEATSLAVVELDDGGGASYRFDLAGRADWQWTDDELPTALPPDVDAVVAGSLALALPPGGRALERFLARARDSATVVVDPNVRPSVVGDLSRMRADVDRWCGIADVIKASSDDTQVLFPGEEPEAVARRWVSAGAGTVVVTLGGEGALAVTASGVVSVPAPPTTVVDTVGAGDTFTAGFLAWLHRARLLGGRLGGLNAENLQQALTFGVRAAAITCSRVGADPPYRHEL
jgi:fructokinase